MQEEENDFKDQIDQIKKQYDQALAKLQQDNEDELREREEIKSKLTKEITDLEKDYKKV